MKKNIILILIAFTLVGCAVPGKKYSITEVENMMETHSLFKSLYTSKTTGYNLAYEDSLMIVKEGAEKCFNITVRTSGNAYTKSAGSVVDFYHELVFLSSSEAMLGVKFHAYGLVTFEDSYKLIARLTKTGVNSTEVKYMRAIANGGGAANQMNDWLSTKNITCDDID